MEKFSKTKKERKENKEKKNILSDKVLNNTIEKIIEEKQASLQSKKETKKTE